MTFNSTDFILVNNANNEVSIEVQPDGDSVEMILSSYDKILDESHTIVMTPDEAVEFAKKIKMHANFALEMERKYPHTDMEEFNFSMLVDDEEI